MIHALGSSGTEACSKCGLHRMTDVLLCVSIIIQRFWTYCPLCLHEAGRCSRLLDAPTSGDAFCINV